MDKAMSTSVIHLNDFRSVAEAKGYFKFKVASTASCPKSISSMKEVMIDVHTEKKLPFRIKWILDEICLPFRLILTAVTGLAVHCLGVFSYAISTIPRWRRAITGSHAHPHTEPTWFGAGTPWRPLAPVSVTCKNEPQNLRDKYVSEKKTRISAARCP